MLVRASISVFIKMHSYVVASGKSYQVCSLATHADQVRTLTLLKAGTNKTVAEPKLGSIVA